MTKTPGHGRIGRGLEPEEVVTRLGVRVEDRSRVTLDELIRWQTFGAVAGGDRTLLVEARGGAGVTEEIVVPLSAGTRLVSHFYRAVAPDVRAACTMRIASPVSMPTLAITAA
ncbi:DUF6461 domain-containing protein [Streptosporangium sp. NPDC023963]|uniref:DUF6461 domain-containing protein n=1 Tax=Streptosporangium sp. NPDC023963 TaxID=3155608 RepID=UPI003423D4E8